MDWQWFLFNTNGRLPRSRYWLAVLVYVVTALVGFIAALLLITSTSDAAAIILYVGGGLTFLTMYFSITAVAAKRLHDRNKTGWWGIPFLALPGLLYGASTGLVSPSSGFALLIVAALLFAWGVVELGCLRGTAGPNRYGDDPLSSSSTGSRSS